MRPRRPRSTPRPAPPCTPPLRRRIPRPIRRATAEAAATATDEPSLTRAGRGQVALLGEPDRDVDDHVFLAADVAEFAGPLEDLVGGHAVALGGPLGVQQKAAVDPR